MCIHMYLEKHSGKLSKKVLNMQEMKRKYNLPKILNAI